MHEKLVEIIVKTCRQRASDGDRPTVKQPGAEQMEFCIIELAATLDRAKAALKEVDNRFVPWGEPIHAEIKNITR